jgi:hypothetical protein
MGFETGVSCNGVIPIPAKIAMLVILVLTLSKAVKHLRHANSPLVVVLFRDGKSEVHLPLVTLLSQLSRSNELRLSLQYVIPWTSELELNILSVLSVINVSVLLGAPHGYSTLLTASVALPSRSALI